MTPERLVPLVDRALGRKGRAAEYADWAALLARFDDETCEQALLTHRRDSPHPPTLADVVKQAVVLTNDRAMRAAAERRRVEVETGIAQEGEHAGQPLVPMPPEIRDGLRVLAQRHQVPDATDLDDAARLAQARAEVAALEPIPMPESTEPVS